MLTHNGQRSKVCTYCTKAFKRQDALDVHLKIHTQDKLYVCEEKACGKLFPSKSALRYHILKFHG